MSVDATNTVSVPSHAAQSACASAIAPWGDWSPISTGTTLASGSTYCMNGTSTSTECSYAWQEGSSGMCLARARQMPSWTGHSPSGVTYGSEQSTLLPPQVPWWSGPMTTYASGFADSASLR